ncbi:macrocin-O-methyltransferase [Alkalicaulis satelles]|uniref:Macrocin-O-methyltransferase n=1 Tax=Alkalicaulis satelles TaxID=2609175 RepID=A0A5M6ZJ93_9PROT|nr:TylF/MycF/NovP-related O-methyltransferase [Alkalicaulis satelles]KAA5804886.1 macrocin-O-methyltransferase [Alkalicaulis satelles]
MSKTASWREANPVAADMRPMDARYGDVLRRHAGDEDIIHQLNAFQRRMYASKAFGHWEVFKMVANLPGHVVECGVYKGESLFNFARFLEILCPGDRTKQVIGFDHFQGLTGRSQADETEKDGAVNRGNFDGGWESAGFRDTLLELIDLFNADSFVPKKPRIVLEEGDIVETAPAYVQRHPGLRISLLHLDCDIYEPTLAALKAFYPHIVPGGIVLLDEYGITEWPGESRAVEEYFGGKPPVIEKFPWLSAPGGWIRKPAG